MATEAGVRAALLAREGYSGPVEVIEGKEGLYEVLHNVEWSTDTLLDGLGEKFLITTCSYKAFPTEALTHQPITAALNICRAHAIAAEDVAEIHVRTTTRGADILSDPSKYQPTTKETADHSLPYCIAAAVADGNVLPSSFEEEKLRDPRIWALLPKIKVVADAEIDGLFPAVKRAIVRITTTDGAAYEEQVDHAKGSPQNPMSDEDIVAKFHANAAPVLTPEEQERVIEATWKLEDFADIGAYMQLLTSDRWSQ
jgi:2-methylcitrate dehydratase